MYPTPTPQGDDSPLDAMTIAGWEQQREVGAALEALDPTGQSDVLCNRYGELWAFRPLTVRAAEWLAAWVDGDPVEPVFGVYSLPVPATYAVDLIDALHDAGLKVI